MVFKRKNKKTILVQHWCIPDNVLLVAGSFSRVPILAGGVTYQHVLIPKICESYLLTFLISNTYNQLVCILVRISQQTS
jgi:hypothetical protein